MTKKSTSRPAQGPEHPGQPSPGSKESGHCLPVKVISREDAVFWLDGQGYWCNRHGRFRNPKISNHFHASIQKDEQGYYLTQTHPDYLEKVYFPFEDTALFVFQVQAEEPLTLVLNTKTSIILDPHELFLANDSLYLLHRQERIKFSERALIQISKHLEFRDTEVCFNLDDQRIRIAESPRLDCREKPNRFSSASNGAGP
mgnify:CR=1 FL=1